MKKSAPATTFRGISIRRRQYDEVAAAFSTFTALRGAAVSDLDADINALSREIKLREDMKANLQEINQ